MGNTNIKLEDYVVEVPDDVLPIILSEMKREHEQTLQDNLNQMNFNRTGGNSGAFDQMQDSSSNGGSPGNKRFSSVFGRMRSDSLRLNSPTSSQSTPRSGLSDVYGSSPLSVTKRGSTSLINSPHTPPPHSRGSSISDDTRSVNTSDSDTSDTESTDLFMNDPSTPSSGKKKSSRRFSIAFRSKDKSDTPPQDGSLTSRRSADLRSSFFGGLIQKKNRASMGEEFFTPRTSLYKQYFKDDSDKILGDYVTALRSLSRDKIREEIRSVDPDHIHTSSLIREELEKGNIREAMRILDYHDYMKLSPNFDISHFQKEIETLQMDPSKHEDLARFKFMLYEKKRRRDKLGRSTSTQPSHLDDDFDITSRSSLMLKWIQVILMRYKTTPKVFNVQLLTEQEALHIYKAVQNFYRLPCPLPEEELFPQQNQESTDKEPRAKKYIDIRMLVAIGIDAFHKTLQERDEKIEILGIAQAQYKALQTQKQLKEFKNSSKIIQTCLWRAVEIDRLEEAIYSEKSIAALQSVHRTAAVSAFEVDTQDIVPIQLVILTLIQIDRLSLLRRLNELEDQVMSQKELIMRLNCEIETLEDRYKQLESDHSGSLDRISSLEIQISDLLKDKAQLQTTTDTLEANIATLKDQLRESNEAVHHLSETRNKHETQITELSESMKEIEEEYENMKTQSHNNLKSKQEIIEAMSARLEEKSRQCELLEDRCRENEHTIESLQASIRELTTNFEKRVQELCTVLEEAQTSRDTLQKLTNEQASKIDVCTNERDSLEQQLQLISDNLSQERSVLEQLRLDLEERQEAIIILTSEKSDLNRRVEDLEQKCDLLVQESSRVSQDNSLLQGQIAVLGSEKQSLQNHIQQLQQQNNVLENRIVEQASQIESILKTNNQLSEELTCLKIESEANLNSAISTHSTEKLNITQNFENQISALTSNLDEAKATIAEYEQLLETTENEKDMTQKLLDKSQQQITDLESTISTLNNNYEELEKLKVEEATTSRSKHDSLSERILALERELENINQHSSSVQGSLQSTINSYESRLALLTDEKTILEQELVSKEEQIAKLNETNNKVELTLSNLRTEYEQTSSQLIESNAMILSMKRDFESETSSLMQLFEYKISELNSHVTDLEGRLNSAKQVNAQLNESLEESKATLALTISEHADRLEAIQNEHSRHIGDLSEKHTDEISSLGNQIDTLKSQILDSQQRMSVLWNSLSNSVKFISCEDALSFDDMPEDTNSLLSFTENMGSDIKDRVTKLTNENQALQQHNNELQDRIIDVEEEIKDLTEISTTRMRQYEELKIQSSEFAQVLQSEIDSLKKEHEQTVDNFTSQLTSSSEQLELLKKQLAEKQSTTEELISKIQKTQNEYEIKISLLRKEINEASETIGLLRQNSEDSVLIHERTLADLRADKEQLSLQIDALQGQVKERELQICDLSQQIVLEKEEHIKQIEKLDSKIVSLSEEMEGIEIARADLSITVTELQDELVEIKTSLDSTNSKLVETETSFLDEKKKREDDRQQYQNQIDQLQLTIKQLDERSQDLLKELEETREKEVATTQQLQQAQDHITSLTLVIENKASDHLKVVTDLSSRAEMWEQRFTEVDLLNQELGCKLQLAESENIKLSEAQAILSKETNLTIQQLFGKIETLQQEIESFERQSDSLKKQQIDANNEIEVLKAQIQDKDDQLSTLLRTTRAYEEKINELEQENHKHLQTIELLEQFNDQQKSLLSDEASKKVQLTRELQDQIMILSTDRNKLDLEVKSLKEELDQVNIQCAELQNHINEMKQEHNDSIIKETTKHELIYEEYGKKIANLENTLESTFKERDDQTKKITNLELTLASLSSELVDRNQIIDHKDSELSNCKSQIMALEIDIKQEQDKVSQLESVVLEQVDNIRKTEQQLHAASNELNDKSRELRLAQNRVAELERELVESKEMYDQLSNSSSDMRKERDQKIAELLAQVEKCALERIGFDDEISKLQTEITTHKNDLRQYQENLSQELAEKHAHTQRIEQLEVVITELSEHESTIKQEYQNIENELQVTIANLEETKKMIEHLETEMADKQEHFSRSLLDKDQLVSQLTNEVQEIRHQLQGARELSNATESELQKDLNSLREESATTQHNLQKKIAELNSSNETMNTQLQDAVSHIETLTIKHSITEQNLREESAKTHDLESTLNSVCEEKEKVQAIVEQLTVQLSVAKDTEKQLQEEVNKLVDELKIRTSHFEQAVNNIKEEHEIQIQKLKEEKSKTIQETDENIVRLASQLQIANEKYDRTKEEVIETTNELNMLKKQFLEEQDRLNSQIALLQANIKESELQKLNYQTQINELDAKINSSTVMEQSLRDQIRDITERLELTKQQHENEVASKEEHHRLLMGNMEMQLEQHVLRISECEHIISDREKTLKTQLANHEELKTSMESDKKDMHSTITTLSTQVDVVNRKNNELELKCEKAINEKNETEVKLQIKCNELNLLQEEKQKIIEELELIQMNSQNLASNLSTQLQSALQQISSQKFQLEHNEAKINELNRKNEELIETVNLKSKELDDSQQLLSTTTGQSEKEILQLKELNLVLTEDTTDLSKQVDSLQEQVSQLELDLYNQITNQEKRVEQLNNTIQDLNSVIDELKQRVQSKNEKILSLEHSFEELQHTFNEQNQSLIQAQQQIEMDRAHSLVRKQQMEQQNIQIENQKSEISKLEKELQDAKEVIEMLKQGSDNMEMHIKQQMDILESEKKDLRDTMMRFELYSEETGKFRLEGITGLSGEYLKMGQEMRKATKLCTSLQIEVASVRAHCIDMQEKVQDFKDEMVSILEKLLSEHSQVYANLTDLKNTFNNPIFKMSQPNVESKDDKKKKKETDKQRVERLEGEKRFIVSTVDMFRKQSSINVERVEALAMIVRDMIRDFKLEVPDVSAT